MDLSICIAVKNRSRVKVPGYPDLELLGDCVRSLAFATSALKLTAEVIVADFASTDWPLEQWLPERAAPMHSVIVGLAGEFSNGRGKNAAAEMAAAPVLLFTDADMLWNREAIDRGLKAASDGWAYFPRYSRQAYPGSCLLVPGSGHGCCILPRTLWAQHRWPEPTGWGGEDNGFYAALHMLTRESMANADMVFEGLLHQWHPLSDPKRAASNSKRSKS